MTAKRWWGGQEDACAMRPTILAAHPMIASRWDKSFFSKSRVHIESLLDRPTLEINGKSMNLMKEMSITSIQRFFKP
jgi:hypothetical protein